MPGGHRDAGRPASGEVHRRGGERRALHGVCRGGTPRDHGKPRVPEHRRDGRPERPARNAQGDRALEGEGD